MSLYDFFLDTYTSDVLQSFVQMLGGSSKLTRKAERAQYIAKTLLDPTELGRVWAEMDELSKTVVSEAYYNDGFLSTDAFIARYGALPRRQRKHQWDWYGQPMLLELLMYDGQLHDELMPLLADFVTQPEPFRLEGLAEMPNVLDIEGDVFEPYRADTEEAGWHDLLVYLQLVEQNTIRFSSSSTRLTPASVETLLDNLLQGDFFATETEDKPKFDETIRPFGLTNFAIGAGLVSPAGTGKLTEKGSAFLRTQDPYLLLKAFETWTEEGNYDELQRIDALKGRRARGIKLTKPGERRERIVEALSWCPTGVWIPVVDFYRATRIWQFSIELEQGGPDKLYLEYPDGTGEMWLQINNLYTNVVLWEYLGSIGALDLVYLTAEEVQLDSRSDYYYYDYEDLTYSRYDGLFYFRINPLGAFLFGQASAYEPVRPRDESVFIVTPERKLTLLNSATLTPVVSVRLEQIATADGERTYHLDAQKILQALEEGATAEELEDFLGRRNQGALPGEVTEWLNQLHKNSRAYAIKSKALLIQASQEMVQMALEDAILGKLCQMVDKRTIVISASQETRFRNRLRELGYGIR